MNRIARVAGVFGTMMAAASLGIEASAADSAKEVAALQAVDQAWAKAYNAGNADAVASLYHGQRRTSDSDQAPSHGKALCRGGHCAGRRTGQSPERLIVQTWQAMNTAVKDANNVMNSIWF